MFKISWVKLAEHFTVLGALDLVYIIRIQSYHKKVNYGKNFQGQTYMTFHFCLLLSSFRFILFCFLSLNVLVSSFVLFFFRPDLTGMVDWALKINYLSSFSRRFQHDKNVVY